MFCPNATVLSLGVWWMGHIGQQAHPTNKEIPYAER